MPLPFTVEEFFGVFRAYNETIWPLQWILIALAVGAVGLVFRPGANGSRIAAAIVATLWLWAGVVYHVTFFAEINPAARVFGAVFVLQSAALLGTGVWSSRLTWERPRADLRGWTGGVLIVFALVVYPLLGTALGHRYPAAPTFGTPCPLTIYTIGLLVWARPPVPLVTVVVPLLWSLVGASAALTLGVREDLALVIAGVIGLAVVVRERTRRGAALSRTDARSPDATAVARSRGR